MPPPPLDLAAWGLPPPFVAAYAARGVRQLYAWQAWAVAAGFDGSSLILSAPTSGGKSLVADILLVRRLMVARAAVAAAAARGGAPPPRPRAAFVLPYASIVSERAAALSSLLTPLGLKVRGYVSGGADAGRRPLAEAGEDVAVLTPEKLNAALSSLTVAGRMGGLAVIVVDEFHGVADPGRGAALEACLAKAVHHRAAPPPPPPPPARLRPPPPPPPPHPLQLIAMSATMAGLDAATAWLGARLFATDERPTPLTEHVVVDRAVYPLLPGAGLAPAPSRVLAPADARDDGLVGLVAEGVAGRAPTLVFCGSRAATEAVAARLAAAMVPPVVPPPDAAQAAALETASADAGLSATVALPSLVRAGVAFHHAGLSAAERAAVEAAFRGGAVLALACTSTLAAGVNLPAARVVLRGLAQGGTENVAPGQYKQMCGRAGRAGLAAAGDAYVVVPPAARAAAAALLTAPLPALRSQLVGGDADTSNDPPLERLLLEGVATGAVRSPSDVAALVRATLAAHQGDSGAAQSVAAAAVDALRALHGRGLVRRREVKTATPAVVAPAAAVATGVFAPSPQPSAEPPASAATVSTGVFASLPAPPSPAAPPPPPTILWEPTPRGAAVAAACLPTRDAEALHDDLETLLLSPAPLATPAPLLFAVLPRGAADRGALRVRSWAAWAAALAAAPPRLARAAASVGVTPAYATSRARWGGGDRESDARHGRFLVAAAVAALLDGAPPSSVARRWARVCAGPGADPGAGAAPPGELQRAQADAGRRAALGAAVADAAGWSTAAGALYSLADACEAGCRGDARRLVAALPPLDAQRARALAGAGLASVASIARAGEDRIARALLAPVTRAAGRRKRVGGVPTDAGTVSAGGAWAAWARTTAAAVRRAARTVLEAEAAAAEAVDGEPTAMTAGTTQRWG